MRYDIKYGLNIHRPPKALPLKTLLISGALEKKEKKMSGGAQCLFQLPEEAKRVKGNQISPIKYCFCWGTSQRWGSGTSDPFAAPHYLLSRRAIHNPVVIKEVSRGNGHHYSLASDALKVTTSKFCEFPFAARLTGLAIRGQ